MTPESMVPGRPELATLQNIFQTLERFAIINGQEYLRNLPQLRSFSEVLATSSSQWHREERCEVPGGRY